jgi:hypothetical protein
MRTDLVADLPFPELAKAETNAIESHVKQAAYTRDQAAAAEDEAARIIEQEVIPAWLD